MRDSQAQLLAQSETEMQVINDLSRNADLTVQEQVCKKC